MSCELCCVTGSVCQIVTVNSSPRLHFIFSSHLLLHLSCLFIHPFLFICPAPVTAPHSSTYVSIFFAPPPSVSYQFNFSLTLQLWSLIKAADWVQSQVIRYRFISAGTPPPHRHYNRSTDIYYCSGLGPPYTRLHCREWAIVKCLDTVLMSFITEHQKSLTPVYEAEHDLQWSENWILLTTEHVNHILFSSMSLTAGVFWVFVFLLTGSRQAGLILILPPTNCMQQRLIKIWWQLVDCFVAVNPKNHTCTNLM